MQFKTIGITGPKFLALAALLPMLFLHCSSPSKKNAPIVLYRQQPIDWITPLTGPKNKGILTSESYSDSLFTALFKLRPNLLSMEISSNTSDSVYILWNECFIIFPNKTVSKVLHSHIPFEERLRPLPMVMLSSEMPVSYFIAPKNKLAWNLKDKYWRSFPLLEGSPRSMEGDKITFVLVLHHRAATLRYPFEFSVEKVLPITLTIKNQNLRTIEKQPPPPGNAERERPISLSPDTLDSSLASPAEGDTPIREEDIRQGVIGNPAKKDPLKTFTPKQPKKNTAVEPPLQKKDSLSHLNTDSTTAAPKVTRSQKGINHLLEKLEARKKLYTEENTEDSPEPESAEEPEATAKPAEAESSTTTIPIIDFSGGEPSKKMEKDSQSTEKAEKKAPKPIESDGVRRSVGSI